MKFNPLNSTLYTNDGKLIKKMFCPYSSLKWDDLSSINKTMDRFCSICENNVVETKDKSEAELLRLMDNNPETCLKIDFNQDNIRISNHV